MFAQGFEAEFSPAAIEETNHATAPTVQSLPSAVDLRKDLWSSIDNDTTRDLDQLEVVEQLANGDIRVRVAIADVAEIVKKGSATDKHAALNTSSVYTGVETFAMLPERLSTDLTSLMQDEDRLTIVVEFTVNQNGDTTSHNEIGRAHV